MTIARVAPTSAVAGGNGDTSAKAVGSGERLSLLGMPQSETRGLTKPSSPKQGALAADERGDHGATELLRCACRARAG
jgi:hypothetical protein